MRINIIKSRDLMKIYNQWNPSDQGKVKDMRNQFNNKQISSVYKTKMLRNIKLLIAWFSVKEEN